MKIKTICLFLIVAALATTAFSQKNFLSENGALSDGQFSAPVHETALTPMAGTLPETLDAVFDSMTALTVIKGMNAAMRLPDGSVWKRASGLAEEAPGTVPLSTEHLMGMGSITKTFISTTLLLMMEEGMFDLDDSIGQYLVAHPNISGSITIRQVLNHRSGLNDYASENPATFGNWLADPAHLWTADEILDNYVLAPNFPPDSAWSYSNTNYILAGAIIESLTGQPWHLEVRQRILVPLGLTHSFVYPWETPSGQPFAHVFSDLDGDGAVEDLQGNGFPMEGLFSLAASSGCMLTTPADLAIFMEKLFGGHILQPATLAAMQTDYIQDGSGRKYGLGADSFPLPEGIENWGHTGGIIYNSTALFFPSENISLVVQQNDERFNDPADPASPKFDLNNVFLALLDAYLNYSPPSGAIETLNENGITIYPNPAGNSVHFNFIGQTAPIFPYTITITDFAGRRVFSQTVEEGVEISIEHLPSGVYGLTSGAYFGRFVKL